MKIIPLTQGYEAIVDDEFYETLNIHKWHFGDGYAKRTQRIKGQKTQVRFRMHREVLRLSGINLLDTDHIDHKNHNRLDNRLENLRVCTQQANNFNTRGRSKSGYKGVEKNKGKWTARIEKDGKRFYLGIYATAEEAAQVYNDEAIKLFGEHAWLNPLPVSREAL